MRTKWMILALALSIAVGASWNLMANDAGQTRVRGAQPQPAPATTTLPPLNCPEPKVVGTFRSVTGVCTKCRRIADKINDHVPYIKRLQADLNAAIEHYNTECPKGQGTDNGMHIAKIPAEGEPVYCGPDVSAIFMQSLRRVQERMRLVPDNEKGIYDASNPFGDSFMLTNGNNIDQKPQLSSFAGRDKCPTGPCSAKGNSKGQDCYMLWGKCVPQHVMNDIMYGFVGDQVWAPEIAQWAGGHYHEYNSRKNWDPKTSGASYHVGDEISEEMEEDGSVPQDFIDAKMTKLMETVGKDYPEIASCLPCPVEGTVTKWKADFSTREWILHDGRKLLKEDYIADKVPGAERDEAKQKWDMEAQDRTIATAAARVNDARRAYNAAVAEYNRLLAELAECEKSCKSVEDTGRFFEQIFGDVKLEYARNISGHNPFNPDQVKEMTEADKPPPAQPPVTQPPVTQPPVTQPPVTQPPKTEPPVEKPPVTEPPKEPTTLQYIGGVSFEHFVGESPCPQEAGGVLVSEQHNHPLEISNVRVTGTIQPKLQVTIERNNSRNPFVKAAFNCSSPQNGTFTGTITITIRDTVTGETKTHSFPARGTVTGP